MNWKYLSQTAKKPVAYDSLKTCNMVEGVGLQMELKGGDIIFTGPTDVLDELSEEIDNHWM